MLAILLKKGGHIMTAYCIDFKPLIRIPKSRLRNIIGKMLNYTAPKYSYIYDIKREQCAAISCPIYQKYTELEQQIQAEKSKSEPDFKLIDQLNSTKNNLTRQCSIAGCAFACRKKVYQNDKRQYNLYKSLYDSKRLPKSIIRTYILLYALPQEKLGDFHYIRDIDIDLIASTLGICRETALKSINALQSLDFITISHASSNTSFNVIIHDYDSMHLRASQGGNGYLTISDKMLTNLLKIKNVNALRFELLNLLKQDQDLLHNNQVSTHTIKDLRNIMPKHMCYAAYYRKLFSENETQNESANSLFLLSIERKKIKLSLKGAYSLRYDPDAYSLSYETELHDYMHNLSAELDAFDILDVCNLTKEYQINNIKNSLLRIYQDYKSTFHTIKNFGALLRTYCRQGAIHQIA